MGLADNSFPTAVFGYVCPIGSLHDPLGKEGLANVYVDIFSYGKRKGSPVLEILNKLESLGAQFQAEAGSEVTYLYIRCPKENVDRSKVLLDRLLNDIEIDMEDLVKIRKNIQKKLLEIESDDWAYAKIRFYRGVMGERPSIGTSKSIKAISLSDISEINERMHAQMYYFKVNSSVDYILDDSLYGVLNTSRPIFGRKRRIQFTEKSFDHKSVFLGYVTKGIFEFAYQVRNVASASIRAGLTGLIAEEIREKRSAAYITGYRHKTISSRGCSYMYIGVAEKNIVESTAVMKEIYRRVANNELSEKRIETAKNYSVGSLSRMFDSIESFAFLYLSFFMQGKKVPSFQDLKEDLFSVTPMQVKDYFIKFANGPEAFLVNGQLTNETKSKLRELLK